MLKWQSTFSYPLPLHPSICLMKLILFGKPFHSGLKSLETEQSSAFKFLLPQFPNAFVVFSDTNCSIGTTVANSMNLTNNNTITESVIGSEAPAFKVEPTHQESVYPYQVIIQKLPSIFRDFTLMNKACFFHLCKNHIYSV